MKRRDFLKSAAFVGVSLAAYGKIFDKEDIVEYLKRAVSFPIPPLLKGVMRAGVRHYILHAGKDHHFFGEKLAATYSFNGAGFLGPTLLLRRGERVSIDIYNKLSEEITVHGHGMIVPAVMDGTPHQTIASGESWSARYVVAQRACTAWYHPHTLGKTAEQVYKGLAGMIIVKEEEDFGLPSRYGIDDIPVVLQDRNIDDAGLRYVPTMREIMQGYVGETFLTNGAIDPLLPAKNGLLRLRLLNGSNSSVYRLAFEPYKNFWLIATDGGLIEKPVELDEILLSPGERAEIVLDLRNAFGEQFTLTERNYDRRFFRIDVRWRGGSGEVLPTFLHTEPQVSEPMRRRKFVLGMRRGVFTINGKVMNRFRIDEHLQLGEAELWEIENDSMMAHNFHVHGVHFKIVGRSTGEVYAYEKGWKDTVFLPPRSSVKILLKMDQYRDPETPYMYHCHFLEHEDRGMMGQFTVT